MTTDRSDPFDLAIQTSPARRDAPSGAGEPEALLTYRAAARLLGVSDRTVWSLVERGDLPAVRFGRSVRVDPADLRDFIDRAKK